MPPLIGTTIWIGPDGDPTEPLPRKILARMSSVVFLSHCADERFTRCDSTMPALALQGVDDGQNRCWGTGWWRPRHYR